MSHTSNPSTEVLLARLDGQPVARCPDCGTWGVASLFIDAQCIGCSGWYSQWRRTSDDTWETVQ